MLERQWPPCREGWPWRSLALMATMKRKIKQARASRLRGDWHWWWRCHRCNSNDDTKFSSVSNFRQNSSEPTADGWVFKPFTFKATNLDVTENIKKALKHSKVLKKSHWATLIMVHCRCYKSLSETFLNLSATKPSLMTATSIQCWHSSAMELLTYSCVVFIQHVHSRRFMLSMLDVKKSLLRYYVTNLCVFSVSRK